MASNQNAAINHPEENPFVYTRPIDAEKGIWRERYVEQVRNHILREEYVSVLAPRQTGKTTLLKQLLHKRREPFVYIDFERSLYSNFTEMARDFLDKILEYDPGLNVNVEVVNQKNFIKALNAIGESRQFIFLIDELTASLEIAPLFLGAIRAYLNESLMAKKPNLHIFVITGSTDLQALTLGISSPFNIAHIVNILDFEEKEVQEFIRQWGKEKFTVEIIQKIFSYTEGHPFLVQYVCHHLYNSSPGEMEAKLNSVSALIQEFEIERTVNITSMTHRLWEQSGESKKLDYLRRILKGEEILFSSSLPIIGELIQEGCIKEKNGLCVIRNPIYKEILRKNFKADSMLIQKTTPTEEIYKPRRFEEYFKKMKNFKGWAMVSVKDDGTVISPVPEGVENEAITVIPLKPGKNFTMEVKICRDEPNDPLHKAELVIEDGINPESGDRIEFVVQPESFYNLGFKVLGNSSKFFSADEEDKERTYTFSFETREGTEKPIRVFINIFQDIALVLIMELKFEIAK